MTKHTAKVLPQRLPEGSPMEYAPESELGVLYLFSKVAKHYGLRIERIKAGFPDCIATRRGERVRIEFEYRSRNFAAHRHDPSKCDWIVCWIHDWPAAPRRLRIIELRQQFGHGFNVWFQPVGGEFSDVLSRTSSSTSWSVPSQAMVGDLLLYYRTRPDMYVADVFRLSSPVVYTSAGWKPGKDYMGGIVRVCKLKTPLHMSEMRAHRVLGAASFIRGGMQGRPKATAHWPELYQMILARNPSIASKLRRFGPDRVA